MFFGFSAKLNNSVLAIKSKSAQRSSSFGCILAMSKAFVTEIKIQQLSDSYDNSTVDNANTWFYTHEVLVTVLNQKRSDSF
jgi:hypothetical protein